MTMSTEEKEVKQETQEDAPKADKETSKKKSKRKSKKDEQAEQIEELQAELSEQKDKFLRLFAEFDNFKKRSMKERLELMKTAAQETISSLLPVLDDFDRAKKYADDDSSEEQFSEGVTAVYNKLHGALKAKGLETMETTGQVFDAELHNAITEIPAPSEDMKGKIIDTVETGYILNDKIIRHAKVVVGK